MIREDAITSVNLAAIKGAADRARERIYIFSNQGAHLEQETGADWQWGALNRYWVVQAKRLDVVPGRGGGQTYTINLQQLYKVIDQAKAIHSEQAPYLPAYVFYNSMTAAFGNPDGAIATVALNRQDEPMRFDLRVDGRHWPVDLPAHAITTCVAAAHPPATGGRPSDEASRDSGTSARARGAAGAVPRQTP